MSFFNLHSFLDQTGETLSQTLHIEATLVSISFVHEIMVHISNKVLANLPPSLLSSICTNHVTWKGRRYGYESTGSTGVRYVYKHVKEDIALARVHTTCTIEK